MTQAPPPYPSYSAPPMPPEPPRPEAQASRRIPLWVFLLVSGAGLVILALAVGLFVNGRNTSHTLHRTRSALADTSGQLAETQGTLATRTKERDNARNQVSNAQQQIRTLQGELSDSQNQLHATQQLGTQIATVASSLKNCIDANAQFSVDFNAELTGGYFSPAVTDEANAADNACTQANSDYSALVSILRLSGAPVA